MTRRFILLPIFLFTLLGSIRARMSAERHAAAFSLPQESVQVPVRYARILSLSFDSLAADLYWIRFLQDTPLQPADEALGLKLRNELLAAERLDPAFRPIYVHGPVLLSVLGNQHCAAMRLSERGQRRFPAEWRLPFNAGYVCFAELGDYGCASRNMRRAAALPGSPGWLPGLVARFLAATSARQAAADYLQEQLRNPNLDPRIRERLEDRLRDARFSLEQQTLEDAVRAWRKAHGGATPDSLQRLVTDGILSAIPDRDPYGGRYELDPSARVTSSTGNAGLQVFRRESAFTGDVHEKLLAERVEGRLLSYLGKPFWVRVPTDRLEPGIDATLQALACAARWTTDAGEQSDLQVLEARVMMQRDLVALRAARLQMLREDPSRIPTVAEVVARAGVPPTDGFGTPYRLGDDGAPSGGPNRSPLMAVTDGGCGPDCDVTPCR